VGADDGNGVQGSPTTVTHLLWAALHGVVSLHLAGKLKSGRTFEQLSQEMLKLLSSLVRSESSSRPTEES
jgi:hypothetical protein